MTEPRIGDVWTADGVHLYAIGSIDEQGVCRSDTGQMLGICRHDTTGWKLMARLKIKERPILFSAPMVRAILAGKKTQTRRVVRTPSRGAFVVRDDSDGWWPYESDDGESALCNDSNEYPMAPPYGGTGDRLWVRETFAPDYFGAGKPGYRADWTGRAADVCPEPRWKPSIFMRRQDSRITLEVTALRVERLQEITEDDAKAEGIEPATPSETMANGYSAKLRFMGLWDSINGKRPGCAWDDNPWAWVVSFRRVAP